MTRRMYHITAGNRDWIPTKEELDDLAAEFQNAEFDDLGRAVVVTRDSVQVEGYNVVDEVLKMSPAELVHALSEVQNGSLWTHTSGRIYRVLLITNLHSTTADYLPTVVYEGVLDTKIWSRPLHDWYRSMTLQDPVVSEGQS